MAPDVPSLPKIVFVPAPAELAAPPQPLPVPSALEPLTEAPQLSPLFASLRDALGQALGDPLTGETATDADDCDVQQLTTLGLAYWSCSSSTSTFVAADGLHHWTLLDGELVEWVAPTADLPAAASAADSTLGADLICLGPNDDQASACLISAGATTAGRLDASGSTSLYEFQVGAPTMQVHTDLTNLPADYDLYLVDSAGSVVGQSVQEDLLPESIDAVLAGGTYFLYVHSDPGRTADPDHSFTLHLDVSVTSAADESAPGT